MPILETTVSYGANARQEIINAGTVYYLYDQGFSFSSRNVQGLCEVTHTVSPEVLQIECTQLSP